MISRAEPPSWVETNLRRGKFAILLDGLDELPEPSSRASLTEWVINQSSAQSGNLFVLTSRPFGYRENPISSAIVVEVQALTETQIDKFITEWYMAISARSHGGDNDSSRLAAQTGAVELLSRLDQTPSLFQLTANPLLLSMLVNVHYYRGALPGTRAELYDEICDVFLAKRDQARGVRVEIPGPQKRAVLRALAYAMARQGVTEVKLQGAWTYIEPTLRRMPHSVEADDFLRSVENSAGLLVEKERGIYSFAHLTFQEYLTAEYIKETGKTDELVEQITSAWWRETVLLYAAIADATPVIKACLEARTDPSMLALGVQCADETNSLDEEVRQAVDDCLNPPHARIDRITRHTAARARFQLRLNRDFALKKTSFIAATDLTWLEYQYFIDSVTDDKGECIVPDHWHSNIYDEGHDNDPVAGIRFSDAVKFCEWLELELQTPFHVRLPRGSEIDIADQRLDARQGDNGLAYWISTRGQQSKDDRFWPLLRGSGRYIRRDVHSASHKYLNETSFEAFRSSTLNDIHEITRDDDTIVDSGAAASRLALLESCWADRSALDVDQMDADIKAAVRVVGAYIAAHPLAGRGKELQDVLARSVNMIDEATTTVLSRDAYAARSGALHVELRKSAKLAALGAVQTCIQLHRAHGGTEVLPPLESVARPTRRMRDPARSATVQVHVLARALAGLYMEFALLEARITGSVAPAESVKYVRDSRAADEMYREVTYRTLTRLYDVSLGKYRRGGKRFFDLSLSFVALLLLAPLFIAIVAVIRLADGGPGLFRQTRVGQGGRVFTVYKFRTMVVDAEARKAELLAHNEANGALFKVRRDPRVTRVGALLRRWSLDELPQLINVLIGDMSMVGPRPPLPKEAALYGDDVRRRLVVKPGITGLWQVSGASDLAWDTSVRLDLRYVEQWSFMLDLQILWKTASIVLRGSGVY